MRRDPISTEPWSGCRRERLFTLLDAIGDHAQDVGLDRRVFMERAAQAISSWTQRAILVEDSLLERAGERPLPSSEFNALVESEIRRKMDHLKALGLDPLPSWMHPALEGLTP